MATSQNGWTVRLTGKEFKVVKLPPIIGTVRAGDVATVLGYVLDQFDKRVEDADKGRDDWGGNVRPIRGQTKGYSNHASWTAIDVNALLHPRGAINTFSKADQAEIRQILREVENTIRWGGDYDLRYSKRDDMHFEVNVGAAALARVAKKIRSGEIKGQEDRKPRPPVETKPVEIVYKGISKEDTLAVQKYLKRVTKDYKGLEDGLYGPMLKAAVLKYQRRQRQYGCTWLVADGFWGPATQEHMEWVREVQDATNDWGASKRRGWLAEDGDYGHTTYIHVKAVQQVNHITRLSAAQIRGLRKKGLEPYAGKVDGQAGPMYCASVGCPAPPKGK